MADSLLVLAQEDWGVGPNVYWHPSALCVGAVVAWLLLSGWFVIFKVLKE